MRFNIFVKHSTEIEENDESDSEMGSSNEEQIDHEEDSDLDEDAGSESEGQAADEEEDENENNDNTDEDDDDDDEDQDDDDDDEDDADVEDEGEELEDDDGNEGWADALAKVLQQEKPKNKKYLVLSKAKKLADRTTEKTDEEKLSFEISNQDGDDVKPDVSDLKIKTELELASIERKERNNKLQELRVTPAQMDIDREKSFKRIAQKGVVQLFNAVRTQQRDLVDKLEKAGPLDHKRDAVLNNINKRQFLDMLMGSKRAKSENVDNPVKMEISSQGDEDGSTKPSQWSVLRDDFMTNKKTASHWDKDDDDDDGGDVGGAVVNDNSGSDSE